MNRSVNYTTPKLHHYNYDLSRKWYVSFDITSLETGETVRKQFRSDINLFSTIKQRKAEGEALAQYWKNELKAGWSPFKEIVPDLANMSFEKAIDFALENCRLASKTRAGYKSAAQRFKKRAKAMGMLTLPLKMITRRHVRVIMDSCIDHYKLSNKSYNKYLGYLKAIMGRLVEYEIIEINPFQNIKKLPVTESKKFVPYSMAEKQKIREYLFLHHYRYFVILMIIYHTGIRPKEVLALRIKDIDLNNFKITIIPDL